MFVIEDVTNEEVKIALALQMEYTVKLDFIKLLITFPHGDTTMDGEVIVH
ncbi:hypothetical protein ACLIBH_05435 [Virgibacillus sp. W0430]